MGIGEKIKLYRKKLSLTQEELATMVDKTKNVVSNWERGDNKPDADTLEKLCEIFDISPNDLFDWDAFEIKNNVLDVATPSLNGGDLVAIGEKLEELIETRHTNVNKLAVATGVSPQTIYGIIKRNNTKVDITILQAIADELCVTLDYFSDNQREKSQVYFSSEEMEHIRQYRRLDEGGKKAVDFMLSNEISRLEKQPIYPDIEEELEDYRQELLAEKKMKTFSASPNARDA